MLKPNCPGSMIRRLSDATTTAMTTVAAGAVTALFTGVALAQGPAGTAPATAPAAVPGTPPAPALTPAPGTAPTAVPAAPPAAVDPTAPLAAPVPSPDALATPPVDPLLDPSLADAAAAVGNLPHDLTPWGMFVAASPIVQGVMIGLAFASVVTWTVFLAKTLELFVAKRRLSKAFRALESAHTLAQAAQAVSFDRSTTAAMVRAAVAEANLSAEAPSKDGLKERVASRLERIEAAAGRRMNRGTGLLANIGSTGPFVGLFGTVWGIMVAFIDISKAQTTNLAVVAPGIAEALLATGIGLVAAIPAVIVYNVFARAIAGYRAQLADTSAAILRHVSRDMDYAKAERRSARASAAE